MPLPDPYTSRSLGADDPRFVRRTPGVSEIERLFPSPISSGRGRLAVEGGVSVIAGPGMGKTSLMARLARHLDRSRHLATALVTLPHAADHPGEDGFYVFLGDQVRDLRAALTASPRMADPVFAPVAAVLSREPVWDAPRVNQGMTPRGVDGWIAALGAAAVHTPGVCLLFDEMDNVAQAEWKNAFIAALRFTFQSSAGITPVYAIWNLYADEAAYGSNYFRNVTRPVFLEPLALSSDGPGNEPSERRTMVDLGLRGLSPAATAWVYRLLGGHPQLLQQGLSDLCAAIPDEATLNSLGPADVDRVYSHGGADAQRDTVNRLLEHIPALRVALREVLRDADATRPLAKGLIATGLIDRDAEGRPSVPLRVAEVL